MKATATQPATNVKSAARQILEVVPLIMREIRREMRGKEPQEISVSQFRAMGFLRLNEGASLSELADFLGLALPTASKMIDGLLVRKLVTREQHGRDRRRMVLNVSERGVEILHKAGEILAAYLERVLEPVPEDEKEAVVRAMEILRGVFARRARI